MSSATRRPASSPSSRGCAGWDSRGTKSTSNRNAWPCTAQRPMPSSPKGLPIATSRRPTRATTTVFLRAGRLALQSRHARTVSRRERPPRRCRRAVCACAIAFRAARTGPCTSSMASMALSPNSPTRSKTSPCFARTECRPITSPRASTMPISRISHIIRGQDHLTNTFKHLLIFEGLGVEPPQFAHLPLLVAPDGAKLSKRKHGPVVSVTTYRDAGFLPRGFRQLPLPARLVAQERPRVSHARRTHRRLHARRRQPLQRRRQLH